jgi:hypothetical protein
MNRHLNKRELANIKGSIPISLDGNIIPCRLIKSLHYDDGGYDLITWEKSVFDSPNPQNKIIRFFPQIYPVEEVGSRFYEKKRKLGLMKSSLVERDTSLVRGNDGLYRFSPNDATRGISSYDSENPDYSFFEKILRQE